MLPKILHLGVTPEQGPVFAKRIVLTNFLGLLFGVNMSLSALVFAFFGHQSLAMFTAAFALSEFCWPFLNMKGYCTLSRIGMLVSSNLLGFLVSIFLPETGYNNGFLVMAALPVLLFSIRERAHLLLGLLIPLFLYPLSEWAQHQLPPDLRLPLTSGTIDVIRYAIRGIYVLLVFLMFYFLSRENHRAEEELGAALADLEAQRSRAFSSAKFAALGEMAGGMAHEINNPLTAISLTTEKLKTFLLSPEFTPRKACSELEIISGTVHRIGKIVEAMRTFSRNASEDSFRKEPLQTIIDESLALCSERFKNRQIELRLDCALGDFELSCRAAQISQVLLNLLNNSFDAVEELEERWISLEAKLSGDRVVIAVCDSGSSIPPEDSEKIFLPFYTTKPVGRGTGLGLSLSRKIVDDHGGTLQLDISRPNTCFIIDLPSQRTA